MAKQLNVNMAFTADTAKAAQDIQKLQDAITRLASSSVSSKFPLTKELMEAQSAAAQLKAQLQAATNVNTGKLDLSEFTHSMQKSGTSLEFYKNQLQALGPEGSKTFMQLAQAIMTAEAPIKRSNALMTELWTTLKNTARWQISSSILHGFMGSLQSAYGYAQDLNESLNNIRIVTGQSVEQMSRFAEQANRAAKQLSTTTTNYTDAALIYYQQGLNDEEVQKRTEVTIKMANAAGQTAETVSSQMTAVWNNFYDGSKSLEYYADVMTALGASTASSTEEISTGLQKFASVAQTIGLSYEYAASALATITATTRQSADTVGTALKTLFSRMQGLKLGETLDDGTDLTKYSAALKTVGVDIKDANGDLKDMDTILEELGQRWQGLTRDQKVATAQTVAGVRQYNQLMALMENWDFFQENLTTAKGSEGTLQEQANIYAESWEAARKRVKAASESIYNDLIDEKFFISLLNGFEGFLNIIDRIIDSAGGLKGVLAGLATIMLKMFNDSAVKSLENFAYNLQLSSKYGQKQAQQKKDKAYELVDQMGTDSGTREGEAEAAVMKSQLQLQHEMIENEAKMSDEEKARLQQLLDINKAYGDQVVAAAKAADAAGKRQGDINRELRQKAKRGGASGEEYDQARAAMERYINVGNKAQIMLTNLAQKFQGDAPVTYQAKLDVLAKTLRTFGIDETASKIEKLQAEFRQTGDIEKYRQGIIDLAEANSILDDAVINGSDRMRELRGGMDLTTEEADNLANATLNTVQADNELSTAEQRAKEHTNNLKAAINGVKGAVTSTAQSIVTFARGLTSAVMAFNAFKSIKETFENPDLSGWEKFTSILMSLGMAIPALASAVTAFHEANLLGALASIGEWAQLLIMTELEEGALVKTTIAQWALNAAMDANPIGLIIIAITALIALVAGLALSIKVLSDVYNKDAIAAKKAKAAADELADAYDHVKSEAEKISSAFDQYDSVIEKLDSCTKGTDEWKAALDNVNSTVMDILSKNPRLAKTADLFVRDKDGVLRINPSKRNEITEANNAAVLNAQAAAMMASVTAAQAQLIADQTATRRQIGGYSSNETGTFVNAGKILTQHKDELGGLTPEEFRAKLEEIFIKPAGMLDREYQEMINSLMDYQDEIDTLAQATDDVANQLENTADAIATLKLGNDYSDAAVEMASEGYEAAYQDIYEKVITQGKSGINKLSGRNDDEVKAFWERYSRATGTNYALDRNAVIGTDKNRQFQYIDEEGNTKKVTLEQAAAAIAAAEALEQLTGSAEEASDILGNLDKNYSETIQNYISSKGSFSDAAQGQIAALQEGLKSASSNTDFIAQLFGGEENLEAYAKAMNTTVDKVVEDISADIMAIDLSDVTSQFSKSVKVALEGIDFSEFTIYGEQEIGKLFQTIFNKAGKEGLQPLAEMFEGLDPEKAQSLADAILAYDWSTGDVEGFIKQLETLGITVDKTDLSAFIEQMREINRIAGTFESASEHYNTYTGVADNVASGKSIEAEDYDKLSTAAQEYFTRMADGTYQMTGNAEEFAAVMHELSLSGFYDNITAISGQNEDISRFQGMNFNTLSGSNYSDRGYSVGLVQNQVDFLELIDEAGQYSELIQEIQAALREGENISYENLDALSEAVRNSSDAYEGLSERIQANNEAIHEHAVAIAMATEHLYELDDLLERTGDAEAYVQGLQHIAEGYENCTDELQAYRRALAKGTPEEAEFAQEALEASIRAGELAETCDSTGEDLEYLADQIKNSGKVAKTTAKAYVEMAKDQARFDKAVESSIKSYDDWLEELQIGEKTGVVAAKTISEIREAYGNLLDLDGSNLSSSFLKSAENLQLMREAMEGNEEAYRRLQDMARQELAVKFGIDDSDFQSKFNNLLNQYYHAQSLDDIEVGAALNDEGFLRGLQDMINAAHMTAEQATDYLSSMGVDAEIVPDTETEMQESTYTGAIPTVTWETATGVSPLGDGSTITYDIPRVHYDPEPVTVSGPAQMTGFALKVKSANKSSGGSIKSGGSAPLQSNGGSAAPKPKGGGGGGGSKAKEIKHAEGKKDSDKERYHTLLNQLEDLNAAYDRVSKAADRAFGKDKLKLIDGEIQATDDLIKKQKEYIDAIQKNLPTDRAIMEAYAQKLLGFGIAYDESGNIANFDALQDAMYAVYNARADSMDSESTEWQVFEKEFEQLQHWIEQYEETYDLLRDEQDKLQEYLDQQTDLQLKKIQYAIELKLNVADDSLAVLNYQLDRLEDKAFSAAEAIALMGSKVDVLYDKVAADREGLDKVLGQQLSSAEIQRIYEGDMSVLNDKHFTEDQIAAIKEYRDDLLALNEELLEVRKSVQEKVMDTFDEFNEKLEDQIDLFDHYNAILENYKNIIDIVGRSYLKVDKELMKTLNQATINNAINKVKGTKDAYDALVVSQAEAEKALQEAIARGNEIDIEAWEKDLEEIQKRVNDAQENMMQAWEDALQSCAEMFEIAIEDAIDNFNKAMLPFGSLEEFQDAYDKQKEVADQYLEDYDKIYELSKLARNVNNSINDAPNIAGKQKLAKLLEKINKYQEDGVEMSKYDLEYLQKEYDLRLAEIALEEAQNAKSVVRLTRDNEGNYSYSYTADSSAVDDAAQKYEDALHAMQELSSNYIDEMSDQLIDATQKMEEELAAVRVEDYASIEDYYKKIDEIQQYWLDRMGYMQNEFQKALDNNKTLYEQDWQRYADATGYKISADENFAQSYQDTVLGKLFDSEDDIIDFQQRVNDALGDSDRGLIGELLAAYIQWQENTEHAMEAAGTSSEGFAEHMEEAVSGPSGIIDQSQAATDAVDNMATQMIAGFTSVIGAVDQWQSHYSDTMDSIIQKNMDVIEAHNLLVKALSTGDSTTSTSGSSSSSGSSSNSFGSSGASSSGSGSGGSGSDGVAGSTGGNSELSVGSYVDVKSGTKWYADSWGGAPWGWARSGTIQYTADGNPLAYNIEGLGWIRKSDIVGYDSGGYTGEWGPAGKLAMLHEKELVLNPEDSANFLSAIEMVRDFSRYIDLQAQWQSTGLGALVASAIKETDNTLQQQVSITADFPNVSDRNEIEAAFNSLVNTAAQYANRKNPLSGIV